MARKGAKKSGSRGKSERRVLDAYQLAEKAEGRNRRDNLNESEQSSDEEYESRKGVFNAKRIMGQEEEASEESEFEDEELDSDEALGSDDEFDVLNSKFSQTIRDKAKLKKKGEYVDDSEDGYTSIDEDELLPLSAVWDLDDKEQGTKANKDTQMVLNDDLESSSEDSSSEDSESDEENSGDDVFKGFSDEDEEVELSTVKKSLLNTEKNKRLKKKLQNLHLEENEYNLPTNGLKLSLADMMAGIDSSVTKDAFLLDTDKDSEDLKALAVPLLKRIQDRHERKAAYELQIDEVNKWKDVVQENRRAEVLKFPLNASDEGPGQVTSFDPTLKPMNELESKITTLLEDSALLDTKKEAQFEDIAIASLSKEDLKKRQNELRLMRELMFREEKKAKRIKKIKSKTYHKIKNKEIRRNQELVEGDESDDEAHDVKRAKERMTLKHKNNSQWAKSMIRSGMSKDQENRSEMEEMLREGERLRSKIMGRDENDSDNDDKDISDLEKDDQMSDEETVASKLGKGVMAMDFMKNAEKKAKLENAKLLEELRDFESGQGRLRGFEEEQTSINVEKNEGRRVYAPSANKQKQEMNELNKETLREVAIDEEKSLINRLTKDSKKTKETENTEEIEENLGSKSNEENPWLSIDSGKTSKSSKISGVIDKNSSKAEKAQHRVNKLKRSARDVAQEDAIIDMDMTLKVKDLYGGSDEENDVDQDENIHMFKQKDLIKEAFAGDDVVAEFEQEKKQTILDEGDKEEDLTLPGWGDWAGTKKSKRKKIVRKVNGVVEATKRKDKNMKNVIINEKVNKKNIKYQSNGVPYPFETMEQYERSLRMPIGQEWTSRDTHQRMTMPRVIAKHGTVIDPLNAPFK